MEQKKLVEQLIKASNEISKNRKPNDNYIHLSEEFIQQQADERKISLDDMVEIIKKELSNSFCDLYKKQCIGNLCSVTPNPDKCEHLKPLKMI